MSNNDIASEDCFKINFFNIDSYVTKPQLNFDATYSDYRKSNINLATVVRVFGSTDFGIKTCIHIHQHCPHFSLRQKDVATAYGIILDDENAELDPKILNAFIQDVENDLVKYIDSNKNKENIFIVNIEKYYARSFYGYHDEPELFYKIYFNSFWMANQAKNSLEAGSINNFKFVCHNFLEFLLQFYIDHRIYLNVLRFKKISFRKPYEHDLGFNSGIFQSIQKEKRQSLKNIIHYNDLPFSSTCTLECDAFVNDIILIERRKTFPPNHVFNPTMPGIIELWNNQYNRSPEKFENLLKVLRFPDWKQYEQTCPYDRMKKKFIIPDNDAKIPQLDGPNEWEPDEAQKLSCIFRKKCIEIDLKKFRNGVVVCRKIDGFKISSKSVPLVVKNSRFCIKEMTKENFFKLIEKKIKPFHQSKLYLQRLKQELKSYKLRNVKIAQQLKMPKSSDNRLKLCFSNQIPVQLSISETGIPKKNSKQIPIPMLDESNFFKQSIPFNQIPQKLLNISVVNDKTANNSSFLDHKNETFDRLEDIFEWSQCLNMTLMSLELHARIRQNLTPDPNYDPVQMVIFAVYEEFLKDVQSKNSISKSKKKKSNILYMGAIIVQPNNLNGGSEIIILDDKNLSIDFVQTEQDLITKLAFYVGNFDPDIILGYIIDTYSWGYLLQRASILGIEIGPLFSRITKPYQVKRNFPGELDKSPQLIGRIVLNTWRLLRHEFNLRCYTFENVHHHLFRRRFPKFPNDLLRSLWQKFTLKQNEFSKHLIIGYYLDRVLGSLRILTHLNFIRRTFNLSCLFGMQFQDVINRGTQFQVESMLFPLCLSENLLPIRFGQDFIKTQKAAQATPLIFEPRVAYHQEPVAVFDFQSLYPSIVIAYNYCYSTCLGRLQNVLGKDDLFGCYQYQCDRTILKRFSNNVHISPNDVLFVKSNVRRGLLPRMLEEILNTRILVKKELKDVNCKLSSKGGDLTPEQRKNLRALKRQLEISQLGLKMIANVTYGYTNANFSGRMPCVEIADAIVSKGRQTLEEVIVFINKWGKRSGTSAKVIYGDTDSVFVSFPNTSVVKAFEMANFILKEINDRQTYPICLKLEKIYQPCIILAKKRYCGFAYDSSSAEAFFDAKGIETVRRDTCNMTAKIMEKCIRILSQSNGLIDSLKSYLQWEFKKILMGRLSRLEDFVFAREFGGFHNYCNESIIPACIIARKRMQSDPRDQPKFKERVPYVIVDCGETQPTRLADLVREPMDLLKDESLKLNASYYINHVIIPPLVRVLDSVHNDGMSILLSWYEQVKNSHKFNLNLITFKHLKKLSSIKSSLPMDVHWHSSRKHVSIVNIIKYCRPSTMILDSLRIIGRKLKHFEKNCSLCCRADIRTLVSLNQCCTDAGQHQCLVDNCSVLFNYRQAQKDFHCLSFWDQALMLKLLNPNHCPDQ